MMKTGVGLAAVLLCLVAMIALVQTGSRASEEEVRVPGPPPGRVVNHVVDLLDSEINLDTGTGEILWTSEAFDASQFISIVLRATGESRAGLIVCSTFWLLDPQDDGSQGLPVAVMNARGDLFGTPYAEVAGLLAKIACWPMGLDDMNVASGTLHDVKVLLRRP
jgi:hypothetical protein